MTNRGRRGVGAFLFLAVIVPGLSPYAAQEAVQVLPEGAAGERAAVAGPIRIVNARIEHRLAGPDLGAAIAGAVPERERGWVGYSVAATRADVGMCCFDGASASAHDGEDICGVCRLDGERADDAVAASAPAAVDLEPEPVIRVLVKRDGGRVVQIRAFAAACTVDAGGARIIWLDGVRGPDSVRWLAAQIEASGAWHSAGALAESAMAALAVHAGPEAFETLQAWARGRLPRRLREQAIFWLGAARGREGWPTLVDLIENSPEAAVRERAVFAAYVSEQPGTVDLLVQAARTDGAAAVRRSALLWLAHLAGDRAVATIREALQDPDAELRRHAVFALSQLPPDRAVPLLIGLVRDNPHPEVRRQALFWLGQSGDPRALELIEELLEVG